MFAFSLIVLCLAQSVSDSPEPIGQTTVETRALPE
jgi:hypothetical protein